MSPWWWCLVILVTKSQGAMRAACFTNVYKFVINTSACRCPLHMHAGVYYTGTQVSLIPARRCPWYLHADVYYTCLQVTIAQKVTQTGMQLYMTPARRCLWQQHADVFDTCTQKLWNLTRVRSAWLWTFLRWFKRWSLLRSVILHIVHGTKWCRLCIFFSSKVLNTDGHIPQEKFHVFFWQNSRSSLSGVMLNTGVPKSRSSQNEKRNNHYWFFTKSIAHSQ